MWKGKKKEEACYKIEATYKAEINNTLEYLNKKYTEDHFVNIVNSNESNQRNIISNN